MMNSIEAIEMLGPEGKTEECARFLIDDATTPYVLKDVCLLGIKYTMGFWAKSTEAGRINIAGTEFITGDEWGRCEITFTALSEDAIIAFGTGEYFLYHAKLEKGDKATDWSPAPEDGEEAIEGAYASIELTNQSITAVVSEVKRVDDELQEAKASITATNDSIELKVTEVNNYVDGKVGELNATITETASGVKSEVSDTLNDRIDGEITKLNSTIEQTASEIRMEVTGTANVNLLLDSGWERANASYPTARYTLAEIPEAGETVTFTIYSSYMEGGANGRAFSVYHGDGYTHMADLKWVSEGRYSATFQFEYPTSETATVGEIRVYASPYVSGQTIHVGKAKMERGTRSTDWTPSPLDPASEVVAGSTVEINKDKVAISTPEFEINTSGANINIFNENGTASVVEINKDKVAISTPEFEVNTKGAVFNIPDSDDDGSPAVAIDKEGVTVSDLTVRGEFSADGVPQSFNGGIFTVGTDGDFDSLDNAINRINNKQLLDNVILKLLDSGVGTYKISGIHGPGQLYIMPIDLMCHDIGGDAPWTYNGTTKISLTNGFSLTATSALTYRTATLNVGRIGSLGLKPGMKLTMRSQIQIGSGTASPGTSIYVGDKWIAGLSGLSGTDITDVTRSTTFTIPEGAAPWDELNIVFRVSASTACTSGAVAYFRNPRLEIGDSISTLNYGNNSCSFNGFTFEGCSAGVYLHNAAFSNTLNAFHSNVSVNRCTFKCDGDYGNGFVLWGGSGAMYNCYGECSKYAALATGGGIIEIYGVRPTGTIGGMLDTTNMGSSVSEGDTPVETAPVSYKATLTGTYGISSDKAVRQGYTASNGRIKGFIYFGGYTTNANIKKATLRLRRVEGYGKGGSVTVKIYGSTSTGLTSSPNTAGTAVVGTISPGETKTFDVTNLAKQYKAFVLYADDTSVMSGKTYSTNYARFTGTGGGDNTIPLLTITT